MIFVDHISFDIFYDKTYTKRYIKIIQKFSIRLNVRRQMVDSVQWALRYKYNFFFVVSRIINQSIPLLLKGLYLFKDPKNRLEIWIGKNKSIGKNKTKFFFFLLKDIYIHIESFKNKNCPEMSKNKK